MQAFSKALHTVVLSPIIIIISEVNENTLVDLLWLEKSGHMKKNAMNVVKNKFMTIEKCMTIFAHP